MQGDEKEDNRVPTFVIIDEAHNLIPGGTLSVAMGAIREQFRRISAEGRKYGLFLILCSQRPDKLDDLVLSECENQAIMKIVSDTVIEQLKKLFPMPKDVSALVDRCREFKKGRALLVGKWDETEKGVLLYAAMRRTVEGGRNLREEHWASPP
jgi:uncharacterized protein